MPDTKLLPSILSRRDRRDAADLIWSNRRFTRKAASLGLNVLTPATLKGADEQAQFAELNGDVAVVVAYGLLLPRPVLDAPRFGCFNAHASLLPRWRGAAPIQRAIIAGDQTFRHDDHADGRGT